MHRWTLVAPRATANERSFSPEGFYRSGDRVRRFENGYLEVTGRVKDVIHRGDDHIQLVGPPL